LALATLLWWVAMPGVAFGAGLGECRDLEMSPWHHAEDSGLQVGQWFQAQSTPDKAQICTSMGWDCESLEEAQVQPSTPACLGTGPEEDCEQSWEPGDEPTESFAVDLFQEDDGPSPAGGVGLACYGSSAQCSGLPAAPSLELSNSITPTPTSVASWQQRSRGWVRWLPRPDHPGLSDHAAALRRVERPPWA
jgi:hypothetical protein